MPRYELKPGYAYNPLRAHRNALCPCESGVKCKRCCGRFAVMPAELVEKLLPLVRRLDDQKRRG